MRREVINNILRKAFNFEQKALKIAYIDYGDYSDLPSSEMSHNDFLFPLFEKLHVEELAEQEAFVNSNKETLAKIRSFFVGRPKLIGKGGEGIAFDIGRNIVLKLFTDPFSFQAAKEAMVRLKRDPSFARTEAIIHDVGSLGTIDGKEVKKVKYEETIIPKTYNVYYYIMEKMKPIMGGVHRDFGITIKDIQNEIIQDIHQDQTNPQLVKFMKEHYIPSTQNEIKRWIKARADKFEKTVRLKFGDQIKKLEHEMKLQPGWLNLLIQEMWMKFITGRGDLHMGNIGLTKQRELRYYDPAHQWFEGGINKQDIIRDPFKEEVSTSQVPTLGPAKQESEPSTVKAKK